LRSAIAFRQPKPGLIHHTDRGGQYAATQYRQMLHRARMKQSMSRANDCYDNAFMESCFGTFKTELEMTRYEYESVAYKEIGQYIRYYNTRRRHSSLGYLTPEQFERQMEMKRPMESEPENGRYPESSQASILR
jgi:transposase InsO family protein